MLMVLLRPLGNFYSLLLLIGIHSIVFGQTGKDGWRHKDSINKELEEINSRSTRFGADSTAYAMELALQARKLALSVGNKRQEGYALLNLANAYLYNDIYDKSLQYNLEALDLLTQSGSSEDRARALTSLGWLYYDVGDYKTSFTYHSKALQIVEKSRDTLTWATALNAVGLTYYEDGEFQKSLPYYRESLALGKAIHNLERMTASTNNLGDAELALGNKEVALDWLQQSLQYANLLNDPLRQAEVLNSLSNTYLQLYQYKESETALISAQQKLTLSSSNSRKEFELRNAFIAANLYEALQNEKRALFYLRKYQTIYDQILSDAKKTSLAQKRILLEAQKSESEIKLLQEEKELRVSQRNAIAMGIIILSILGFFAYSRERKLRIKEQQLAEANEALTQSELHKVSLEREALNAKLEFKNTELTNLALSVSQRNELLRSFLEELETIRSQTTAELSSQLARTIRRFNDNHDINKASEDFHLNVESEYKDFFFNLHQKFPDLTDNERRLCAQVRLNLSIKDIASINNISVKSVEMARYRLRKKLNISHDANLSDFLNAI